MFEQIFMEQMNRIRAYERSLEAMDMLLSLLGTDGVGTVSLEV